MPALLFLLLMLKYGDLDKQCCCGRLNPPLSGGGTSQIELAKTLCQDSGWDLSAVQGLNNSS